MRYFWTQPNREVKAIEAGDTINSIAALVGGGSDKLTPDQAYYLNGWFRRCVDERADALAAIPWTLSRGGNVVYDTSGFDPLPLDLSYLYDMDALMRLIEASLVITGAAYTRPIVRSGRTTELEWMNPRHIEEIYATDGSIRQYRRTIRSNGEGHTPREWLATYPAEQVVSLYERDPFTEVGPGHTVAMAARVNADVLNSLDRFLDSYMDRGLLPSTIIAVPATTSPEERANFQKWWNRYYRGKDRAGTQRVLNADSVTVQKIGDGIAALGSSEVVQQQREAIAVALGVEHLVRSGGGRGDAMIGAQAFYSKLVVPRAKRIMADLNRQLFAPRGLFFQFQFKRIEALQRALLETARGVQRLVEGPVMTQNEGRIFLGLKRIGDDPRADELGDMDDQPPALAQEASTLAVQEATSDPAARRRSLPLEWSDELGKWRRKVESKGADAPFRTEHIPPRIEGAIRQRLSLGEPPEKAFEPPFIEY